MKVITERQLIRTVADRWREQYPEGCKPHQEDIWKALNGLDKETSTADDVRELIGNDSWCRIFCNECKEYTGLAIQVGEEPDYDSATANLCMDCLTKAFNLMHEQPAGKADE